MATDELTDAENNSDNPSVIAEKGVPTLSKKKKDLHKIATETAKDIESNVNKLGEITPKETVHIQNVRKKVEKLYSPRKTTIEDAKYLEPGEQVTETNNQFLKTSVSNLKNSVSTLETSEYERQVALSEFIDRIELNDDGTKTEHYKKDLTNEQKRRAVTEFNKWNTILSDNYKNYLDSYNKYKKFADDNKDLEITDEEAKASEHIKNFGSEYGKQYVTDTELLSAVSEYKDSIPLNRSEALQVVNGNTFRNASKSNVNYANNVVPQFEPEYMGTKDYIDLLINEVKGEKRVLTMKDWGINNVIAGAWDSTIATIAGWSEILGGKTDSSDFLYKNIGKTRANTKFFKDTNPELFKLAVGIKENADLNIYDSKWTEFLHESANQFGQMGAFILTMALTGSLSLSGKLAVESGKLAESLTIGKFLKAALSKGTFEKGLIGQTYLRSGLAGLVMTYPEYYKQAERDFDAVNPKDRTWLDYVGLSVAPIVKATMEGMSEATGAHFLGGVVGKIFGSVSKKFIQPFLKNNLYLKAVDNYLTHQVLAENFGEVGEERINDIIDYATYATTGKFKDEQGKEHSNFGDFLKEQFKKSLYEFAMFSTSSLFYGKMLKLPVNVPRLIWQGHINNVELKFEEYLNEKYPELLKVSPDFFKDFANKHGSFLKAIKEKFDEKFEEALNVSAQDLLLDKRVEENQKIIEKFAIDKITEKKLTSLSEQEIKFALGRIGITENVVDALKLIDPSVSLDFSNTKPEELVDKANKLHSLARASFRFLTENSRTMGYENMPEQIKSLSVEDFNTFYSAINEYKRTLIGNAYESRSASEVATREFHLFGDRLQHTLGKKLSVVSEQDIKDGTISSNKAVSAKDVMDKTSLWGGQEHDSEIETFVNDYINENDVNVVFYDGGVTSKIAYVNIDNKKENRNRIFINTTTYTDLDPKTVIIHEVLHLAYERALINNPKLAKRVKEFRDRYLQYREGALEDAEMYMLQVPSKKAGSFIIQKRQSKSEREYSAITEFLPSMFQDTSYKQYMIDASKLSIFTDLANIFRGIFPKLFKQKNDYEALKALMLSTNIKDTNVNEKRHIEIYGEVLNLPIESKTPIEKQNDLLRKKISELQNEASKSTSFITKETIRQEIEKLQNQIETNTQIFAERAATVQSTDQIPRDLIEQKAETLFAGEEGRKQELEAEESEEDMFDEIEVSLTNALEEMTNNGVDFVKTTEELYNLIQEILPYGEVNGYNVFEARFEQSLGLLTDEQKQQFNIWLNAKNEEYLAKTARTCNFLQWIYANALTIDKIDYCVLEQTSDSAFSGLKVVRKTRTFSDAYGNNKTIYGKRPLYRQHQAELKKKGITFDILEVNHFVANSDLADDLQIKSANLRSFRLAKGAAEDLTTVLTMRLIREGYIPLYTGGRTLLIVPISSIKIVENGKELSFTHPYYDNSNDIYKSNENYIHTLSSDSATNSDSFINYVINKLISRGRKADYLDVKMSQAYPSENPNKYFDKELNKELTVGEFIQRYSLNLSKSKLNPDEMTDPKTAINKITGKPFTFPTNATFLQATADLITTYFWRRLVFGALLPGIGVDNVGKEKTDLELFKRVSSLNGYSAKSTLLPSIIDIINRNNAKEKSGIWIDGQKVMIRSMILDVSTLPKEMLPEGIENTGASEIGNGATFQTAFVQRMLYALNRVFIEKQGTVSKSKVFKDGTFYKNGTHKVHSWEKKDKSGAQSVIAEFMKLNQVGEINLTTAVKVGEDVLGVQRITWQDILDKKIFETKERDAKYAYTRNLMDNIWIQDGATKNKNVGGFIPVLIRTYLSSLMPQDVQDAVLKVHEKTIERFNDEVLSLGNNPEALRKAVYDFAKSMPFDSEDRQFIMNFLELSDNDMLAYIPQIKEYFVNGRMTKAMRGLFSFRQKGGFPVMTPDMGNLTSYREMLLDTGQITSEQAAEYFDSNGFLKRGFVILDSTTAKKLNLKRGDKVIWVNNPPAGVQDIKPVTYIGNFEGNNAIVTNIYQAQEVSGKDYDFDKLLIFKASNSQEYEKLWNWLKQENFEERFLKMKQEFLDSVPQQWKDVYSKLTDDPATALFLHHFGVSNLATEKITFDRPYIFTKLAAVLERSPIEEIYNIGVYLTFLHNSYNDVLFEEYDEFENFVGIKTSLEDIFGNNIIDSKNTTYPVQFGTKNNVKELERRMAIMSFMTHHALDWQSDPKMLLYDYTPEKLLRLLLNLRSDEAAKQILTILKQQINPIKNITKPSYFGTESISEMKESLSKSKQGAPMLLPKDSFFERFVKSLTKIAFGNLEFNAMLSNTSGFHAKFFAELSKRHSQVISMLGNVPVEIHNEVLHAVKLFASLFRSLSEESKHFNPSLNLQQMIDFDYKDVNAFNKFITTILKNDGYTIRLKNRRIANLNKGSMVNSLISNTVFYEGTGRSILIDTRNGKLEFNLVEYSEGKLVRTKSYNSFNEFYNENSSIIDQYLQTNVGKNFFAQLFNTKTGLFTFKSNTPTRKLVKDVLYDSFKLFVNSSRYKNWSEAHKYKFFYSFLGVYSNSRRNKEIDTEIIEYDKILTEQKEKLERFISRDASKEETNKLKEEIEAVEWKLEQLANEKMSTSFNIFQRSKSSEQAHIEITEEEYNKLKTKGNVRLEEQLDFSTPDPQKKFFKIIPPSFTNYAPSFNILNDFSNGKIAKDVIAKDVLNDTVEIMKQVANPGIIQLDGGQSTITAMNRANELGMFTPNPKADVELKRMLKDNPVTANLSNVEIDNILQDLYNIKEAESLMGRNFNMARYLSDLLMQSQKNNRWANSAFARAYGIWAIPGNRIVNIFSTRNILVSSIKQWGFSVMGNVTKLNANFMQNLQDKHARLGRPELLSGAQINHAFNTQIHYAYEDASKDVLMLHREMMSFMASPIEQGKKEPKTILKSPWLQALAYDMANLSDVYKTLLPYLDPETMQLGKNGGVTVRDKNGKVVLYQFVNSFERFDDTTGVKFRVVFDSDGKPVYQHYLQNKGWSEVEEDLYRRVYELTSLRKFNKDELFAFAEHIYENNKELSDSEELLKEFGADYKTAAIKTIVAGICQNYIVSQAMPNYERLYQADLGHAKERANAIITDKNKLGNFNRKIRKKQAQSQGRLASLISRKTLGKMPIKFQNENMERKSLFWTYAVSELEHENIQNKLNDRPTVEITKELIENKIKQKTNEYNKKYKQEKRRTSLVGLSVRSSVGETITNTSVQYNLKTLDVLEKHIQSIFNYYRAEALEVHQDINDEYLQRDNPFSIKEAKYQNQIIKEGYLSKVATTWEKLKPNMGIYFKETISKDKMIKEFTEEIKQKYITDLSAFHEDSVSDDPAILFDFTDVGTSTTFYKESELGRRLSNEIKSIEGEYNGVVFKELKSNAAESALDYISKETFSNDKKQQAAYSEAFVLFLIQEIANFKVENEVKTYQEDTGETEYARFSYGEITKMDDNEMQVLYPGAKDPITVYRTSVKEINEVVGLENLQKLERWARIKFGKTFALGVDTFRKWFNSFMKLKIQLSNICLLGFQNLGFAIRNYYGGMLNLATYLPSDSLFWIPKNAHALFDQYAKSTNEPDAAKGEYKKFFNMLRTNSASVLGGFDKLLGVYSGIITEAMNSPLNSKQMRINLNFEGKYEAIMPDDVRNDPVKKAEWEASLKTMQQIINTDEEHLLEAGFEPSKIHGVIDFISDFYNRKGLYNVLNLIPAKGVRNSSLSSPLIAEQENRFMTMALGTDRLLRSLTYGSEHELKLLSPIVNSYITSKLQQLNQNTQFQYIPGLFLGHVDSTIAGRAFKQYSHYGNSLNHAFYQRWNNIGEQAEMLGIPAKKWFPFYRTIKLAMMGDNITYKTIHTVPDEIKDENGKKRIVTRDVVLTVKEDNEAQRAIKMFSFSLGLHFLKKASKALGNAAKYYTASSITMEWLIRGIFVNSVQSYSLPSMDFLFDTARFILNSTLRKEDDDDDDSWFNAKIYGNTSLKNVVLGKTLKEYDEEQRKMLNKVLGKGYAKIVEDNSIMKQYYREQASTIFRSISEIGLEEQAALNLGVEMILFAVAPDDYSFSNTALDEVQKFAQRTIPGVSVLRAATFPKLNSYEDKLDEVKNFKEEHTPKK